MKNEVTLKNGKTVTWWTLPNKNIAVECDEKTYDTKTQNPKEALRLFEGVN